MPLGTAESVGVALRVGALWFALNLSFNVSLQLSSVSSVTIISATSSIWTLLIGAVRAREMPGRLKVAATLLTFFGAPLVTNPHPDPKPDLDPNTPSPNPSPSPNPNPNPNPDLRPNPDSDQGVLLVMLAGTKHKHDADSGTKPHMLAGDGVALLSALAYGAYAVQVKHEVPSYLPLTNY